MRAVSEWLDKNREKLWFSVLVNAGVLFLLLLFFRPAYESNDDYGICNFVSGAKGVCDPHLVYSNYILGLALSVCYRICQRVPWYALAQYAALFLGFTASFYVMQKRLARSSALWGGLLLVCFFAYEGYVKLQFTKTAGLVSASGLLLLIFSLSGETVQWREAAAGLLLSGIGFMYRQDQFLAEIAALSGICISLLLELRRFSRRDGLRRLGRYAGGLAVLFLVIAGLYTVDRMAYRSEEWQDYREYIEALTQLQDYGFPSYSEHEEEYAALGLNRRAYGLYANRNQMDTDKFTTEVMEELIALKEPKKVDGQFVKDFFDKFPFSFTKIPSFFACLLLCFFALAMGRHQKSDLLAAAWEALVMMGLYGYLFYRGRYLYNRVDAGLWFAASLTALWMAGPLKESFSHRVGLVLVLSVLCVFQNTWQKNWKKNTENRVAAMLEERAVMEAIRSDSDHLYLLKAGTVSFSKAYGAFDSVPFGAGENIFPLGGWAASTPTYSRVLEKYGVSNPFKDMVGNSQVYLIDEHIDNTLEYLHAYYSEDAEAEEVMQLGSYTVYQIHGEINQEEEGR